MKQHLQQIDVLKGLAIIAVLLLHSFSREQLVTSFAVFHIWQAVPVFMIIMGLNLGMSYGSKTLRFQQLYTAHYFQKKGTRILLPLLIIYAVALMLGYAWQQVYDLDPFTLSWKNFIGVLPVSGKGNYFITLLLQSLLFLPLIGYSFLRWPFITCLALLFLEITFQLISYHIWYFNGDRYLYDAAFFRYLTAIGLGLLLSRLVTSNHKCFGWLLVVIGIGSGLYLYLHQYYGLYLPYMRSEWQAQLFLTFPYAALLIYLGILAFPQQSENVALKTIASVGQASYHIFLVQVLYFGLIQDDTRVLLNVAICLMAGQAFYWLESNISKRFFT